MADPFGVHKIRTMSPDPTPSSAPGAPAGATGLPSHPPGYEISTGLSTADPDTWMYLGME
jgi:hypothetical protein